MEYDLIIARSVTFAQRMQKALEQAGIRCRIFRAPRDLTDLGCAYAVQIPRAELKRAWSVLRRAKLDPVQILGSHGDQLREVGP